MTPPKKTAAKKKVAPLKKTIVRRQTEVVELAAKLHKITGLEFEVYRKQYLTGTEDKGLGPMVYHVDVYDEVGRLLESDCAELRGPADVVDHLQRIVVERA